jgi:hypothetical protein
MQFKMAAFRGQAGFHPAHRFDVVEVISDGGEIYEMNTFELGEFVFMRVAVNYSFNLANRFNYGIKPGQVQQVSIAVFERVVKAEDCRSVVAFR